MADGAPCAFFNSQWRSREIANWLLQNKPLMVAPSFNPDAGGIRYRSFSRGFCERTGTLLMISRETWKPLTIGNLVVARETHWLHLSMSFQETESESKDYGKMRQVLPADHALTEKWIDLLFGAQKAKVLAEPPISSNGIKFDVWHYRLFCNELFLPADRHDEIWGREFTQGGWLEYPAVESERRRARK